LEGKCDDLPEGAFFMVGDIEDARRKAEGMHYIVFFVKKKIFFNINIIAFLAIIKELENQ
jgi:hypothetical protein